MTEADFKNPNRCQRCKQPFDSGERLFMVVAPVIWPVYPGLALWQDEWVPVCAKCLAVKEQVARGKAEGLLQELEKANRKLQDYAQQAQALAVVEERSRLARDLHDSVTQSIFSISLIFGCSRAAMLRRPC